MITSKQSKLDAMYQSILSGPEVPAKEAQMVPPVPLRTEADFDELGKMAAADEAAPRENPRSIGLTNPEYSPEQKQEDDDIPF